MRDELLRFLGLKDRLFEQPGESSPDGTVGAVNDQTLTPSLRLVRHTVTTVSVLYGEFKSYGSRLDITLLQYCYYTVTICEVADPDRRTQMVRECGLPPHSPDATLVPGMAVRSGRALFRNGSCQSARVRYRAVTKGLESFAHRHLHMHPSQKKKKNGFEGRNRTGSKV